MFSYLQLPAVLKLGTVILILHPTVCILENQLTSCGYDYCICTGSHFLHRHTCSSPGSSRHVPPKVAQKNLEEYYRNVKCRVDKELLQHTKQKEEEGRGMKEDVQNDFELQPVSEPKTDIDGDQLMTLPKLSKQRKSRRWFKKFGAHSIEYSCDTSLSPYRDSTPKESEKTKLPKAKKKWSIKGKGQHKRELIELERCNSLVMGSKKLKRGSWEGAECS